MKLRFFFDWSGDYLWAGDDITRAKYGYPVDPDDLPLSHDTKAAGVFLAARWIELNERESSGADAKTFAQQARELFNRVVAELGGNFEVLYEV